MKWAIAGEAFSLPIHFMVDGEYVQPDLGSVTLTLRNSVGTIITGYDALSFPDLTSNVVQFPIEASANNIDELKLFESRFVMVAYSLQGEEKKITTSYRLTRFLPIQASAQDVRDLIGAQEQELPDDALSLYGAYFYLLSSYPQALPQALTSDNAVVNLSANKAVALQAAIEVLPSLPGRMMLSESQDNADWKRNKLDFELLEVKLRSALINELKSMTDGLLGTVTTVAMVPLFFVTSPTDVITGV